MRILTAVKYLIHWKAHHRLKYKPLYTSLPLADEHTRGDTNTPTKISAWNRPELLSHKDCSPLPETDLLQQAV